MNAVEMEMQIKYGKYKFEHIKNSHIWAYVVCANLMIAFDVFENFLMRPLSDDDDDDNSFSFILNAGCRTEFGRDWETTKLI